MKDCNTEKNFVVIYIYIYIYIYIQNVRMEYIRFFPNLQGGRDYIKEAEKQLGDNTVYEEINYNKKILS